MNRREFLKATTVFFPLIGGGSASPERVSSVFLPEDYGAVGDGITDDTAAIQAAINAAGVNGGNVILSHDYLVSEAGITGVGGYHNIKYALMVNANNVHIKGPGTIRLAAKPAMVGGDRWNTILFTKTPPGANPIDDNPWIDNVGIQGVRFDNTAISFEERATLNIGVTSVIEFAHARNFHCLDNIIMGGFGEGAIHIILGSRQGRIDGNTIIGTPSNGMWLDGMRGCTVNGNRIIGEYWDYTERVNGAGIVTAANQDNYTNSGHNVISDNVLINCRAAALSLIGVYQKIVNNLCIFTEGGVSAISVGYNDNHLATSPSTGTEILNNTCIHRNNISIGRGIKVFGTTSSIHDGQPVEQVGIVISGNRVSSGWGQASIDLGPHVKDSWVINNYLGSVVAEDVTCSGNVLEPNY